MKKILLISATSKTNYDLSKELKKLLVNDFSGIDVKIISLEDYELPLYTAKNSTLNDKKSLNNIRTITDYLVESDGVIFAGPEYNGSIPPILVNTITWISTTTEYWRDAFLNKIGLIVTSSGGGGNKFLLTLKIQLEHLGMVVMPRNITINNSSPLKKDSAKKILKQFVNLA
ncbi:MAG: hypothetical protein CMG61_01020 [Candidatus Marinimicrobia bacterium]|nr:hypothetical protein [Candidatus Neomarinimicrobiota bacterium]|tara:strand:- start:16941 stop:17456 length:516 start_codon:yes stop_codon:yes gene_type:complete